MKRHRGWLAAAATVPLLALAACSGSSSPASTQQPVNQVFTYDTTVPVMVDGWDPATEYSDGIIAMSEMYETLTRYDSATKTVEPLLATSWSPSADGKTWTFHLRHGVYFHTGRLMTAQAAKDAIQRTIKLGGGASYVWGAVTTIDTPDQYTLVLHQKYPSPLALEASADYSAYIYDTQAGGGGAKLLPWLNAAHDAGTGPYTVQKWNKGQELEVTLTRFGKYWGGWSGSHFTKVVFRVVPQDSTAAQLLRSGQVSFIEQISPSLWSSFKGDSAIKLVQAASWQNLLAQLNVKAMHPAGPSGDLVRDRLPRHPRGPARRGRGLERPGPAGHVRALQRPAGVLPRPGQGGVAAQLGRLRPREEGPQPEPDLHPGRQQRAGGRDDHQVRPGRAERQPLRSRRWPGRPSGPRASRTTPPSTRTSSWSTGGRTTPTRTPGSRACWKPRARRTTTCRTTRTRRSTSRSTRIEQLVATNKGAATQTYRNMQVTVLQQAPLVPVYNDNYQYAMLSGISGLKVNPAYPNVVFVHDLKP